MCCYDWGCKKIWKSNSFRISYDGMLLQAGFMNKEIIIKEQHNCCSTEYWETKNNNFYFWHTSTYLFSEVRQFTKSESFGCYFVCLQV